MRESSKCVTEIAADLNISPQRVRQVLTDLAVEPFFRVGNVPFYDWRTIRLIEKRNTKPGPKSNGNKKGKK